MEVESVEVIDNEASERLRREVRRERRQRTADLLSRDPRTLLLADLSVLRANSIIFQNYAAGGPQVPPVRNELADYNEEDDGIALVRFAQRVCDNIKGQPLHQVSVRYSGKPILPATLP